MINLFTANLGGVYSLFVGMSVLSFIEILYFFTVRLYKNYKQIKTDESRHIMFVKPKFSNKLKSSDLVFTINNGIDKSPGSSESTKTIIMTGFIQ